MVGTGRAVSALLLGTTPPVLVRGSATVGGLAGVSTSVALLCAPAAASAAFCIFLRWALPGLTFLAAEGGKGVVVGATAEGGAFGGDEEAEAATGGLKVIGGGREAGTGVAGGECDDVGAW